MVYTVRLGKTIQREFSLQQLGLVAVCALALVFFSVSKQGFLLPQHQIGQVLGDSTTGGEGNDLNISDPNFFQKMAALGSCTVDQSCQAANQSSQAVASSNTPSLLQKVGGAIGKSLIAQAANGLTDATGQRTALGAVAGLVAGDSTQATNIYPRGLPIR